MVEVAMVEAAKVEEPPVSQKLSEKYSKKALLKHGPSSADRVDCFGLAWLFVLTLQTRLLLP